MTISKKSIEKAIKTVDEKVALAREAYYKKHGGELSYWVDIVNSGELGLNMTALVKLQKYLRNLERDGKIVEIPRYFLDKIEPEIFLTAISTGAYDPIEQKAKFFCSALFDRDCFLLEQNGRRSSGLAIVASAEFLDFLKICSEAK